MASADLLRREEEFYESLFDSAKGDAAAAKTRGQMIERKIEALEDMATKVSNRRSRRWLNDRLLIELVPRLHVEEIKGLFAPPPFGE
uniref:R3H-associated N-terminal domain-containing protein n=2 Tax=Aegilops tauschii TaxID=37682 RepID=A0A453KBF5_AEGTS